MSDIEAWLEQFKDAWTSHDIEQVLELFTKDVVYHESPSDRREGKEDVREAWQEIKEQENIDLSVDVFSSDGNKHTVQWELSCTVNGSPVEANGVYLIQLTTDGRCCSFWQYTVNS